MTLTLETPPAQEPVSVPDIRDFLRITHAFEDALLERLITSARHYVETQTRRVLIDQTWSLYLDRWPRDGTIRLPITPIRALSKIRLYDVEGKVHEPSPEDYRLSTRPPAELRFLPGCLTRTTRGIDIIFQAGYGSSGEHVPASLVMAIRILVAFWYENRGNTSEGPFTNTPSGLQELITPLRVPLL